MSLQLGSFCTDHTVLQQGVTVPVWGTADPGQCIARLPFTEYLNPQLPG
jgi:hypothetical protein